MIFSLLFFIGLLHIVKANVIIIGSGISGLSAADRLIKNGVTDIQILEARDRYGGRAHTVPFGNDVIEYGAQWIHGKNPIYTLGKSIGILDESLKTEFGDLLFMDQSGASVDGDYFEEIYDEIDDIIDNIDDVITGLKTDTSLLALIDQKFNSYLSKKISKNNLNSNQVEIIRAIYEARLKEEKFDTSCDPLNFLSAIGWHSFEDSLGDDMINIKGGYASFVNYFVSRISTSRIRLNEVVKSIDYSLVYSKKVRVTAQNRLNGVVTVYEADQVLVTVPLGYLKLNHRSLFYPSLPVEKVSAIERLGFGTVNKVFLVFNENFGAKMQGLQILWRRDIGKIQLQSMSKWSIDSSRFYEQFGSFEVHPKMKNVLYAFITGQDASYIESLPDQCVLEVLSELLSRYFPNIIKSPPRSIARSKWASDEFTRGSYSHIRLGSSSADVKVLSQPINKQVFFAGEHTFVDFISTVHGAYQSGLRAADRIIGKK